MFRMFARTIAAAFWLELQLGIVNLYNCILLELLFTRLTIFTWLFSMLVFI